MGSGRFLVGSGRFLVGSCFSKYVTRWLCCLHLKIKKSVFLSIILRGAETSSYFLRVIFFELKNFEL